MVAGSRSPRLLKIAEKAHAAFHRNPVSIDVRRRAARTHPHAASA